MTIKDLNRCYTILTPMRIYITVYIASGLNPACINYIAL